MTNSQIDFTNPDVIAEFDPDNYRGEHLSTDER